MPPNRSTVQSRYKILPAAYQLRKRLAKSVLFPFCLLSIRMLHAQQPATNPWSDVQPAEAARSVAQLPAQGRLLKLDVTRLQQQLIRVPQFVQQSTALQAARTTGEVIRLPMPDGSFSRFRIMETPVMSPKLAAKFPGIKTYAGQGIDDPTATVRLGLGSDRFHAFVLADQGSSFIRATDNSNQTYLSYYSKDTVTRPPGSCEASADPVSPDKRHSGAQTQLTDAGNIAFYSKLRKYRLAVATTGQYYQAAGGTKAKAMETIVETINQVSAIFTRDLSVMLILTDDNDKVLFASGGADPYTSSSRDEMLKENQPVLDKYIGPGNYDIGHVFGKANLGGVAIRGTVCNSSSKGKGVSSVPDISGSGMVALVAHEMGHQFGAYHTFNAMCDNNREAGYAYEPGGGTTIMGYGLGCSAEAIGGTDLYFHAKSIAQMQDYILTSANCSDVLNKSNQAPVAFAAPGGLTIPANTPFYLFATGMDADGDALTYTFEQIDQEPVYYPLNAPQGNSPLFRSVSPGVKPSRMFPNLESLRNNVSSDQEKLPSYNRSLHFRFTVRDNYYLGGATHSNDITVHVSAGAGPFKVTSPNTANANWQIGSVQNITWAVANTTQPPVNCAKVNILLSVDGGLTFPYVVAENVKNNGQLSYTVPNDIPQAANKARLKIRAADNYFFDISDKNFSIAPPVPVVPNDPKAVSVSISQLNVSWFNSPYATYYQLDMASNPNPTNANFTSVASPLAPSFQHKGLIPGKTYYYRVKACNGQGCSDFSPVFSGTTLNDVVSQGEAPAKVWDVRFGGTGLEEFTQAVPTADGGFLLGGTSSTNKDGDKTEYSRGGTDFWVVKINANGDKVWDRRFGGVMDDKLNALLQTPDGGFLLGGQSYSGQGGDKSEPGWGGSDYWVVKVDKDGSKQWDKRFGGTGDEAITSLSTTNDGKYLLGGISKSPASGNKSQGSQGLTDFWLVKIDGNGLKLWDVRYGGTGTDQLSAIAKAKDGSGFLVSGYSNSGQSGDKSQPSRGSDDYWVLKLDNLGIKQWDKRFGGGNTDVLYATLATKDGGYLLGGTSNSALSGDKTQDNRGGYDYWVVKISGTGTQQWDKRFGGSKSDGLASLAETADGGYALAGSSTSGIDGDKGVFNKGMADYWLVKINSTGQMQWNKGFGGQSNDYLRTLVVVPDGYLLAGYSYSGLSGDKSQPTQGESDFWAVKSSLGTFEASVQQLTLYNATTDAFSKQLYNGIVLDFAALGTNQLSIVGITKGTIGSVQFKLDGKVIRTENHAPYSIAGDAAKSNNSIDFMPWTPAPGKHTLVVTPFKESNGIGLMGMTHTLQFEVSGNSSRIAAQPPVEEETALSLQVFPNPVADATTIAFSAPAGGPVNLAVYDLLGTQVQALHNGPAQSGNTYQYSFSRQNLKPGVYICRLVAGTQVMDKKIVVR